MATSLSEKKRIYTFTNDQKVVLEDVTELKVSNSGNHRLKTADGSLHVIPNGWIHIEIKGETDWTI